MIVSTSRVGEFQGIEEDGDVLVIRAAATHSQAMDAIAEVAPDLWAMMRRFGGAQVRNAGTVCGNIANGSPIGDMPPALIAAGATLELGHRDGGRRLPLEDYFVSYGRQDRRSGEYVRAVHVPVEDLRRLSCHKVSKRFDSDITAVLACIALKVEDGVVNAARIAFGGMAATPKRAHHAEAALLGRPYERAGIDAAAAALEDDFAPITDLRASAAYRLSVARNLLVRDFLERTTPETPTRLAGAAVRRVAA